MKVSFVLLAYKKPDLLRPLIEMLLASGSDIYVHYDASSPYSLEDESNVWGLEKFSGKLYHAPRVKVSWGEYSIVQATLNTLNLARKNNYNADYFMLISGSCMPIKPIWKLEEFLKDRNSDIIEAVDATTNTWITAGIQKERWENYHYINWRFHPKLFGWSLKIQKKLKIKRKLPLNQTPYMGSQWWCLRASTVEKILTLMDENPILENFYRRTWVPDELFFQTMVGNLIPHDEINHEILTRYKFNAWGVPRVYYDGDLPELLAESTFFARKVSNREKNLREQLKRICQMDKNEYETMMSDPENEYAKKLNEKFYFDNHLEKRKWHSLAISQENEYEYIKTIPNDFIIVVGGDKESRYRMLSSLKEENIEIFGDLFGEQYADFCIDKQVDIVAGYSAENRKYIDSQWHLFLGDLAFKNENKTIAFSISGDSRQYLEKLKWKENLAIIVLNTDSVEQLGETALSLNELTKKYVKQKIFDINRKFIGDLDKRHCQVFHFDVNDLSGNEKDKTLKKLFVQQVSELDMFKKISKLI